ncbi:hypothetical protein D3C83_117160 [compost metagenome]
MPVEAVVGGIGFAVVEPAEERRLRLIQGLGEKLVPEHMFLGQARPVALEILFRFRAQLAVRIHAGNVGLLDEGR